VKPSCPGPGGGPLLMGSKGARRLHWSSPGRNPGWAASRPLRVPRGDDATLWEHRLRPFGRSRCRNSGRAALGIGTRRAGVEGVFPPSGFQGARRPFCRPRERNPGLDSKGHEGSLVDAAADQRSWVPQGARRLLWSGSTGGTPWSRGCNGDGTIPLPSRADIRAWLAHPDIRHTLRIS
jgi:hypothetical protein